MSIALVYTESAYQIEEKLIRCYDIFVEKIFGTKDIFHALDATAPRWIAEAGISSDSPVNRNKFQQLYERSPTSEELNKLLYYYDCDNLVSSMQNVFIESFHLKNNVQRILKNGFPESPGVEAYLSNYTGHRFLSGEVVVELFSFTNMLFINLYSQLDYITKLFYEIQNICSDFSKYPKMRSSGILYGDKGKIEIDQAIGTLFESDIGNLKLIVNFRNEIVHNGTLDSRQKLFQKYEKGKISDRFILLPDTNNGNLEKFKGRSHFYGAECRWQDIIPPLFEDFCNRLASSLDKLILSTIKDH